MLNKVIIIGNLGRDPEIRTTQSGQTVANFSVATTRRWRDRDGKRRDETEWHRIVCWGRQAEVAGQYLTRGKLVSVEGRLQTRSWDDQQTGQKRFMTEIICDNFQMLGGRADNQGQGGYGGRTDDRGQGGYGGRADDRGQGGFGGAPRRSDAGQQPATQDDGFGGQGDSDDDIPF